MLLSCQLVSVFSVVYYVLVGPVCLKVNGCSLQIEEVTAIDSDEDKANTATAKKYLEKTLRYFSYCS